MKQFNPEQWQPAPAVVPKQYKRAAASERNEYGSNDVAVVVDRIERAGMDIAPTYNDWLTLGFALASEFGEAGRGYFHRVSCMYASYNPTEAEKQYDRCLSSKRVGITIRSFFQLAKNAGININTYKQHER